MLSLHTTVVQIINFVKEREVFIMKSYLVNTTLIKKLILSSCFIAILLSSLAPVCSSLTDIHSNSTLVCERSSQIDKTSSRCRQI